MPTPREHKTVQARILEYAEATHLRQGYGRRVGWTIVSREEAEKRRGGIPAPLGGKNGGWKTPAPLSLLRFATDLRAEFPDMRGFSSRSIWEMKRFYVICTEPDFLQQAVADFAVAHNKPLGQAVPDILAQAVRELDSRRGQAYTLNVVRA